MSLSSILRMTPITGRTSLMGRAGLVCLAVSLVFATFAAAGPRAALLMSIGLGLGLLLEGLRFGFAGPWRLMWVERDARGLVAQFLAVALFAVLAFPLLALAPDELAPAHAPIGVAMIGAAFVFGVVMQVVMGCGSGVLVNAGSGNFAALLALPGFIAGSFLGSLHLNWWTGLGSLPVLSMQGLFGAGPGLWLTLTGLIGLTAAAIARALPGRRLPGARLWLAAVLLAGAAEIHLVIAGQSWGVVYGLGLWGAKFAQWGGMELASNPFWSSGANAERLQESVLTDVTSLTNFGLLAGALLVMNWRRVARPGEVSAQVSLPSYGLWVVMLVAGLMLGYSARVAFGCNVGAYFSGIATGSLHGWVWFVAAFFGAGLGIRLRNRLFAAFTKPVLPAEPDLCRVLGPGRSAAAITTVILILLLLLVDARVSVPINPFAAPPPAAWGSGLAPAGAHCTQL